MTDGTQNQYTDVQDHILRMSTDLYAITPMAMMLRGFGAATRSFSISNSVAEHVHNAALEQARTVQEFSHVAASIWITPAPITPLVAAVKIGQTQRVLLAHLQRSADDSVARFEQIRMSATDLMTIDDA